MTDEPDDPSAPYRVQRNTLPRGVRSPKPIGRSADFVADVRALKGDRFVQSWLSEQGCEFTDTAVFTWRSARSKLYREVGHLAKKHHVAIVEDGAAGLARNATEARTKG